MKWIGVVAGVALLLGTTACGGGETGAKNAASPSPSTATPSPTATTTPSSTPSSTPSNSPAAPSTSPAPTANATPTAATSTATPVAAPPPAGALDLTGAKVPQFVNKAGDITCLFDDFEGIQVRCDVLGAHWKVTKPSNCQEAYGDSLTMGAAVVLTCHGDTIFSPDVDTVVAAGKSVRFHDFTCTVAADSVSCRNGKDAGFTVSKATWSKR